MLGDLKPLVNLSRTSLKAEEPYKPAMGPEASPRGANPSLASDLSKIIGRTGCSWATALSLLKVQPPSQIQTSFTK